MWYKKGGTLLTVERCPQSYFVNIHKLMFTTLVSLKVIVIYYLSGPLQVYDKGNAAQTRGHNFQEAAVHGIASC